MSVQSPQYAWTETALSKVDPRSTALLVIDLQNDFCCPDGALAMLGSDITPCAAVVRRIADFLPRVRKEIAFTAFFRLVYDPNEMSESQQERLIRNGLPVICIPGTRGADLSISPDPEDLVFAKHRYSAFSNDRFRQLLHERSIATIVTVGVDTHICVEGTVRQGYDLGYRMIVLSDLVATRQSESARHENSLALCGRYFALVLESNSFIDLLNRKSAELLKSATG